MKLFNLLASLILVNLSFSQHSVIKSFTSSIEGQFPTRCELAQDETYLYGTTQIGGDFNEGVIFRLSHDGLVYSKLFDFSSNASGRRPSGSLTKIEDTLYGMTYFGGDNDLGIIFKIDINGNNFVKLHDFDGLSGSYPVNSLVYYDDKLIGVSESGGLYNYGCIFSIDLNGNNYLKLHDFNTQSLGRNPQNSILPIDNKFYGLTLSGGNIDNHGVIYRIDSNGNNYEVIHVFDGTNGRNPRFTNLIQKNETIYGLTNAGGVDDRGIVFSLDIVNLDFFKLLDFDGINGSSPFGSLFIDGSWMYGVTRSGGLSDFGAIFKIRTDGAVFEKLYDFDGVNGKFPLGSLISNLDGLYGISRQGATSDLGTVYRFGYCPVNEVIDEHQECEEFEWIDGQIYTGSNNIAEHSTFDMLGCETLYKLDLVIDSVIVNVQVTDSSLISDQNNASYQWLSCDLEYSPILGENEQNFTPETSGYYSVEITNGSCKDTSECYLINILNIKDFTNEKLNLFPNPINDHFIVFIPNNENFVKAEIIGLKGDILNFTFHKSPNNVIFDINNIESGVYFLRFYTNRSIYQTKIIVSD